MVRTRCEGLLRENPAAGEDPGQDQAGPLGLGEARHTAGLPADLAAVAGLLNERLAGVLPEGVRFGWEVADDEAELTVTSGNRRHRDHLAIVRRIKADT